MFSVLRTFPFAVVGMMLTVNALSFENFIDPLMRVGDEKLELEFQLSELGTELGRVVDDAARNLFNISLDTSTKITYANALIIIFGFSAIILAIFYLTSLATYSIFTGINEENGNLDLAEILSSETAHTAARLFLSYINSTTTISASYALVIILGISIALLGLLGLAYLAASAIFTGTSVNSYYGKRSLPDGEEDGLGYNWLRIIEILHEMDEHFRRLGVIQTNENDCRKRLICKLFENDNTKNSIDENEQNLKKLASQLSEIYETNNFNTDRPDSRAVNQNMKSYRDAVNHGKNIGQCNILYPKCSNF